MWGRSGGVVGDGYGDGGLGYEGLNGGGGAGVGHCRTLGSKELCLTGESRRSAHYYTVKRLITYVRRIQLFSHLELEDVEDVPIGHSVLES